MRIINLPPTFAVFSQPFFRLDLPSSKLSRLNGILSKCIPYFN